MRLTAIAAPDSSGHYRIRQPIEQLQSQGVEGLEVLSALPVEFNRGEPIGVYTDADVVLIQRPMLHFMPGVIDVLHRQGTKVIIDLDDDFHTAHADNIAFQLNHPRRSRLQNWHHLTACVRKADLITVSTDQLARRYGSHRRVAVVRNCVDDDWLDIKHRGDGRTLGWAGTVLNHPTDLQATRGGVAMALADHPEWRFVCIGGAKYVDRVQAGLELPYTPEATDWKPLELHSLLVSSLDVGIVPLADTLFNAAKSWLKGIEYAALGIPFVASDLPEYRLLRERHGLGELATPKARSWRRRLGAIMELDGLRKEYAEWSRDRVRTYLTVSRNAWRWQEVWEAVTMSRQRWALSPTPTVQS